MLTRQVDFLKAQGRDRAVHQPELRARADAEADAADRLARRHVAARQDAWRATASTTGSSTSSSPAGWPTPTRSASSCSPSQGIELADVYVGPQGVLTGSARQAQEAKERADGTARLEDLEQRRVDLERRREAVEAQTAALWREFEDEADVVRAPARATARRASRTGPASAPSRAGCAAPTPTSRRSPRRRTAMTP